MGADQELSCALPNARRTAANQASPAGAGDERSTSPTTAQASISCVGTVLTYTRVLVNRKFTHLQQERSIQHLRSAGVAKPAHSARTSHAASLQLPTNETAIDDVTLTTMRSIKRAVSRKR